MLFCPSYQDHSQQSGSSYTFPFSVICCCINHFCNFIVLFLFVLGWVGSIIALCQTLETQNTERFVRHIMFFLGILYSQLKSLSSILLPKGVMACFDYSFSVFWSLFPPDHHQISTPVDSSLSLSFRSVSIYQIFFLLMT